MIVNKIKITEKLSDKNILIPLDIKWDYLNREDSVNVLATDIITEIIGSPTDYEVERYSKETMNINGTFDSSVEYNFNFFKSGNTWVNSFIESNKFTFLEIYNEYNSFKNSFFKIDLYDTLDPTSQKNYLTIILQSEYQETPYYDSAYDKTFDLKIPKYILDFYGDKQGYFIYWYKNNSVVNINKFYMTAKYFDAKTGNFIQFTNTPQSNFSVKTKIPNDIYYYEVNINYNTYKYSINKVGQTTKLSKLYWYEYINPE
jgi:hypothetical protein